MHINKRKVGERVGYGVWYMSLLFFAWLMWLITIQYIPAQRDTAFLNVKQNVVQLLHYRVAFFVHVYTSMFVLVSAIIQFSSYARKYFPTIHKISGRVYVVTILLLSGPTGLVMGYYANGGPFAQIAFCLLAILWMAFTFKGFTAVREGNITAHKKWMMRSYALTLSAISLRLWKWLLVYLFEPKPMDVYQVVAWLGWIGNLLIAEIMIYYLFHKRNLVIIT